MGRPSRQCQVCNQAQSKYKCPSCLVSYCSLACFKTHKVEYVFAKRTTEYSEPMVYHLELGFQQSTNITEISENPCVKSESAKEKSGTPYVKSGSTDDAVTTSVKPKSTDDAETPIVKPESSEERSTVSPGFQVERKLEVDDPSEVLQILQMQAIASSSEVREVLKDEHLQKLISDIDSSPDPLNELDKAMAVDVFRIFSDKILSAINP